MSFGRTAALIVGCVTFLANAEASEPSPAASDQTANQAFKVLGHNCFECHGISKRESGLDLRYRETFLKGGERGPALTPGSVEDSILYYFVTHRTNPNMPPAPRPRLSPSDLDVIEKWIEAGAPWPEDVEAALKQLEDEKADELARGRPITEEERSFWSFQAPKLVEPQVNDSDWARNEIDRYILAKLETRNLEPSAPASKYELIRRATIDLTGIPPTPGETLAFVNDTSPDAFAKVVDRLLASPRYGERWGRHWLDVARYSDSNGYEFDYHRPDAWRYRDYVISAFNQDKPYDRFILEQLAGDELPDRTTETLIAVGFNRLGPTVDNQESEEIRMNELDDMVSTTSSAFLGVTIGCARCHDHKYDPIRQADYYRLQAVFFPTEKANLPLATEEEIAANKKAREEIDDQITPLRRSIETIERGYREEMRRRVREERLPPDIREAFATPEDQRTEGQKLIVSQANRTIDAHYKYDEMEKLFTEEHREAIKTLRELIGQLDRKKPAPLPVAMGLKDSSPEPKPAHFLHRGNHNNKGPEVQPAAPAVLNFTENDLRKIPTEKSTLRRTALAEWIAHPDNPLTARVMVNRIWHHHFGRGIVATPSDFGNAGERPTHLELLDYLALKFIENGWSIKSMHRLIMNSAAYQMSSAVDPAKAEIDSDNALLWRQNPQRLEAEALRDSILAVAGRLNPQMGGPAYLPPLTEEMKISIGAALPVRTTDDPEELHRRTVYMYQKRNLPQPMLEVFDLPDSNITCSRRDTSTVPTQALTLFNNEFIVSQAEYLAKNLVEESGDNLDLLVRAAGWRILSRPFDEAEMAMSRDFVRQQLLLALLAEEENAFEIAMTDLCRVLMNTNEFVYVR